MYFLLTVTLNLFQGLYEKTEVKKQEIPLQPRDVSNEHEQDRDHKSRHYTVGS